LGVKEEAVREWEDVGGITMSRAERLANLTNTPFGCLFLPEPPVDTLPIADFRTVGTTAIARPSTDLLDVLNGAMLRQDWYRSYLMRAGAEPLEFVDSLKLTDDVATSARKIRETVGWDTRVVALANSIDDVITKQVEAIEQSGVTVTRSGVVDNNTHRKLSVREFRGFALSDKYAPAIFVNSADAKAAQMFTLAHELVHIWLGVSGVSTLDRLYAFDRGTEQFCNRVAAEMLVPADELRRLWRDLQVYSDRAARLQRHFRVSALVILRRLRDESYLSQAEFREEYDKAWQEGNKRSRPTTSRGNFYTTLAARTGKHMLSAIVTSTLEGTTRYKDAMRLLGVNSADMIGNIAEKMVMPA
jgi:Zn-dependent peptidase ImmA (M78 family)